MESFELVETHCAVSMYSHSIFADLTITFITRGCGLWGAARYEPSLLRPGNFPIFTTGISFSVRVKAHVPKTIRKKVGTGQTDGQTDRQTGRQIDGQHRYIMGPPSRKDGPIIILRRIGLLWCANYKMSSSANRINKHAMKYTHKDFTT